VSSRDDHDQVFHALIGTTLQIQQSIDILYHRYQVVRVYQSNEIWSLRGSVHLKPSRHIQGLDETIEGFQLSFMDCTVRHKFVHCISMAIMGVVQLVVDGTSMLGLRETLALTRSARQASTFHCSYL
jgi:hypothetical protein